MTTNPSGVERRRNPGDRRLHALHLTAGGQQMLAEIGKIGRAHEEITGGLTASEREELAATLQVLAARHGLTPGVHPGYKSIGRNRASESADGTAAGWPSPRARSCPPPATRPVTSI